MGLFVKSWVGEETENWTGGVVVVSRVLCPWWDGEGGGAVPREFRGYPGKSRSGKGGRESERCPGRKLGAPVRDRLGRKEVLAPVAPRAACGLEVPGHGGGERGSRRASGRGLSPPLARSFTPRVGVRRPSRRARGPGVGSPGVRAQGRLCGLRRAGTPRRRTGQSGPEGPRGERPCWLRH